MGFCGDEGSLWNGGQVRSGCKIGNGIDVVGKFRVKHSGLDIWGVAVSRVGSEFEGLDSSVEFKR